MSTDNGNWLSAEQAVLPDGTERENLSLVNRKLPTLAPPPAGSNDENSARPGAKTIRVGQTKR